MNVGCKSKLRLPPCSSVRGGHVGSVLGRLDGEASAGLGHLGRELEGPEWSEQALEERGSGPGRLIPWAQTTHFRNSPWLEEEQNRSSKAQVPRQYCPLTYLGVGGGDRTGKSLKDCPVFRFTRLCRPQSPRASTCPQPHVFTGIPRSLCLSPRALPPSHTGPLCLCSLTGISPFVGENDRTTLMNIRNYNVAFEETTFLSLSREARGFLIKVLVRDRL